MVGGTKWRRLLFKRDGRVSAQAAPVRLPTFLLSVAVPCCGCSPRLINTQAKQDGRLAGLCLSQRSHPISVQLICLFIKCHITNITMFLFMFQGLLTEHYDKHPVFILKDVKFKELKAMMDYMYRGEVNISQDQLSALLKAAESLQIKGLSDSKTGGSSSASTTGKGSGESAPTRQSKSTAGLAAATAAPTVDIPHASSGLTIEKNKVPRQSLQQVSVSDLPEDSASPQLRGLSSR